MQLVTAIDPAQQRQLARFQRGEIRGGALALQQAVGAPRIDGRQQRRMAVELLFFRRPLAVKFFRQGIERLAALGILPVHFRQPLAKHSAEVLQPGRMFGDQIVPRLAAEFPQHRILHRDDRG